MNIDDVNKQIKKNQEQIAELKQQLYDIDETLGDINLKWKGSNHDEGDLAATIEYQNMTIEYLQRELEQEKYLQKTREEKEEKIKQRQKQIQLAFKGLTLESTGNMEGGMILTSEHFPKELTELQKDTERWAIENKIEIKKLTIVERNFLIGGYGCYVPNETLARYLSDDNKIYNFEKKHKSNRILEYMHTLNESDKNQYKHTMTTIFPDFVEKIKKEESIYKQQHKSPKSIIRAKSQS